MHLIIRLLPSVSFILLCALLACEKEKGERETLVTSVSLNHSTAEMKIGETLQLVASVNPANATDQIVNWASSKQSVATVTKKGLVIAKSEGMVIEVSSLALNTTFLELAEGENATLVAAVSPDDAEDKTVLWKSTNDVVAQVRDGVVNAIKEGSATIIAKCGRQTASCVIKVYNPNPTYVDMGVSVMWGTYNLGAKKKEDFGDRYAWGEITPKEEYTAGNYRFANEEDKYKSNGSVLELEDDAAHVNWGGSWRMPTKEEWEELFNNCSVELTNSQSVYGMRLSSKKTGASIFLPSPLVDSEYGRKPQTRYWTSSLHRGYDYVNAYSLHFGVYLMFGGLFHYISEDGRSNGFYIRPVYAPHVEFESIH